MNPFMKKAIATLLAALAIAAGNLIASDLDLSTLKDAERIADQLYYEAFHESLAIPPGSEYSRPRTKSINWIKFGARFTRSSLSLSNMSDIISVITTTLPLERNPRLRRASLGRSVTTRALPIASTGRFGVPLRW